MAVLLTHHWCSAATAEVVTLNAPHAPPEKAIEAFNVVLHHIKSAVIKSRHHWDVHEPKMWSRASGISDSDLVKFTIEDDLVEVRSGPTSYGVVIFGKIRIPAVDDEEGEGFVHVRFVIVLCHSNVDVTLTSASVGFTIPPIE